MTSSIRSFLVLLAHTNLLLAIGAFLATFSAFVTLQLPFSMDFTPMIIVFLITFSIYNFNRRTDLKEDHINHPDRVRFIRKHGEALFVLSILSYATALSLALMRNFETFLISFIPIIIIWLYGIAWTPTVVRKRLKFSRLKEIIIVKNVVVSLTWASMLFVLLFYFSEPVSIGAIVFFMFLFVRFFINTVMFDVRDTVGDRLYHIDTIPNVFSIKKTQKILYVLNFLLGVFLLVAAILNLASPLALYLINLSTLYGFWYISRIGKNDIKFLADVIVDGEYFVIGALALVAFLIL
jgi:4-hydroxybenzoate polyprenyltransferase